MVFRKKNNITKASKIESKEETQGLMTDEEIKTELLKIKEFLESKKNAEESFLNSWSNFKDSEQYKQLKNKYPKVFEKVDLTNIPLGIAHTVAFKNGCYVYKNNILSTTVKSGYGFSFSEASMFRMFSNRLEKFCLQIQSKQSRKSSIES